MPLERFPNRTDLVSALHGRQSMGAVTQGQDRRSKETVFLSELPAIDASCVCSHAGIYVPLLTLAVAEGNDKGRMPFINIQVRFHLPCCQSVCQA